jgi:small subunit ribosomal protein S9
MATASSTKQYYEGVGRRKSAVARVRISEHTRGNVEINSRDAENYFPVSELRAVALAPLKEVKDKHFSISIVVYGGGVSAQAGAISLGLARALTKHDQGLRGLLKPLGLLTRDSRVKERKKFGLRKARRAPQWSKR